MQELEGAANLGTALFLPLDGLMGDWGCSGEHLISLARFGLGQMPAFGPLIEIRAPIVHHRSILRRCRRRRRLGAGRNCRGEFSRQVTAGCTHRHYRIPTLIVAVICDVLRLAVRLHSAGGTGIRRILGEINRMSTIPKAVGIDWCHLQVGDCQLIGILQIGGICLKDS